VFFDCYALIMDIYREMLGINLKNFPREWGEWKQDPPRSSYDLHFAEAGFERTTRPKPFDVVVMRCGGKVTNHAGVLMPNNEIFHHVGNPEKPIDPSRFAVRESMGRWKRAIEGGYWLTYSKGIA
jgi:cell wall-associated NlpC family hydrolase